MRQLEQTMWHYLTNSWVTLITLVILFAVLGSAQLLVPPAEDDPTQLFDFLIINNVVISAFIGVYIGGGLYKLKASHLWKVNPIYRQSLIVAFLIVLAIFSAIQALIMSVNLNQSSVFLLLPICVALFSSYIILGEP